ncbi:MAG: SRPBCC family protein, partial [Dehalococcoidia bacterium]
TVAILSVEGEPLAEGTTYRERSVVMGPWKSESRWKVTRFQPHSIQVHEGHLSGVGRVVLTVGFEPADEGARFSMALRYDTMLGPLGALLDRLMINRMMQRSFDRSVLNFKARVEALQGS